MDFGNILRRAAQGGDRTQRNGAAVPEKESMEEGSVEVQAVRKCIAVVVQAREAHALVARQKETLVSELSQTEGELRRVREQLAARERAFALTDAAPPDEPFPEESEITRLGRHIRIWQERVRSCEGKLGESQNEVDARVRELEKSWSALGAVVSERLAEDFRDAASALRTAHLRYLSLSKFFYGGWSSSVWRCWDRKLAIADPRRAELLLDPLRQEPEKWPPNVQDFLKSMSDLRAEIEAAKSE
jgi:hypothetical protein